MTKLRLIAPLIVAFSVSGLSAEWAPVPSESTIGFTAFSRMHDVDGRFATWTFSGKIGDDFKGTGRITLKADSIESGNAKRDRHLKDGDFLNAAAHPDLVYDIERAELKGGHLILSGKLTIRGVSRPVNLDLLQTTQGSRTILTGETTVNRRDFGIDYNSLINPIKDEIKLKFRVVLARK